MKKNISLTFLVLILMVACTSSGELQKSPCACFGGNKIELNKNV